MHKCTELLKLHSSGILATASLCRTWVLLRIEVFIRFKLLLNPSRTRKVLFVLPCRVWSLLPWTSIPISNLNPWRLIPIKKYKQFKNFAILNLNCHSNYPNSFSLSGIGERNMWIIGSFLLTIIGSISGTNGSQNSSTLKKCYFYCFQLF